MTIEASAGEEWKAGVRVEGWEAKVARAVHEREERQWQERMEGKEKTI